MREERLNNGLILRSIQSDGDVAKCAEFNTVFNNDFEGQTYQLLHKLHPTLQWQDSYLVENELSGEVAATICLIPWEFDFEGVTLRAAQLEMVLSHPEYRRQGLIRLLINHFINNVSDSGYDLSIIWGIPFYYRQYGYSYCMYGNGFETLPTSHIPDAEGPESGYRLRGAKEKDIPDLTALYNAASAGTQIRVKRNERYWAYLLTDVKQPVKIVEDTQGSAAGYLVYTQSRDGIAHIFESGISNHEIGLYVFQTLKKEAYREILVGGSDENTMVKAAKNFGSLRSKPEQWLVRITQMSSFIRKLSPVLERRLANSEFAGINGDIVINLYRQAYKLSFCKGKLVTADDIGFKDSSMGAYGGDLCIPQDAFIRLLFGFRTLDQLTDAWPDIVINPAKRCLFDILFPRLTSHIYLPYHYLA